MSEKKYLLMELKSYLKFEYLKCFKALLLFVNPTQKKKKKIKIMVKISNLTKNKGK